tara:strand:+ start:366 stop:557 length:192 start_codon:yes stop_codon:yes gene_type:complete
MNLKDYEENAIHALATYIEERMYATDGNKRGTKLVIKSIIDDAWELALDSDSYFDDDDQRAEP